MAQATGKGSPISQESNDALCDAKKKKPRKFVLVVKGSSDIQALAVFRKGQYKSHINAARSNGQRGNSYCGIVVGNGSELNFQLAGTPEIAKLMKVDGAVTKEPTKKEPLKKFLNEHCVLKSVKPCYTIITDPNVVAPVSENDDEEGNASPVEGAERGQAEAGAAGPDGGAASGGEADAKKEAIQQKLDVAKTRWQAAKKDFRSVVDQVLQAIQKAVPEEGQKIVDRVEEVLDVDGFFDSLSDAMDKVSENGGEDIKPLTDAIKQYAKRAADPVVLHMDKNPFVNVKLSKVLVDGLKDLAKDAKALKA